jgi:uncharacterized membrane protein YhhN
MTTVVQWLLPSLALATLAGLLWLGERRGDRRMKWRFKPMTSTLFLLMAVARDPAEGYDWLIFAGLVLSAVGDLALIPASRRWFLVGLVAFLLAHVAYTAAFGQRANLSALPPAGWAAIVAASIALFLYFRPHLGAMLWPVAAYVAVITLMLIAAWAVFLTEGGRSTFGWLVATGAMLFYLSDITVARDRFIPGTGFTNRAVGLPLYYVAQFLLAFSIGA